MTNIYELNRSVFATTSKVVKPSRKARKAMAQPLDEIIGIEMSYEDCCEVNGGGTIKIGISAQTISRICSMACSYVGGMYGYVFGTLFAISCPTLVNLSLSISCLGIAGVALVTGLVAGLSAMLAGIAGYIVGKIVYNYFDLNNDIVLFEKSGWLIKDFECMI